MDSIKGAGREPTTDERRLWRFVTRGDTLLHGGADDALDIDDYAAVQAQKIPEPVVVVAPPEMLPKNTLAWLALGQYAGVDKRTAERFRKGKMPIEMLLDLHGHSQIDAFAGLQDCIEHAMKRRKRMLLVVTGKGRDGVGVLRQSLPLWLNAPSIRPFVLAFDVASRKDGGEGAFYVLLKRQRAHG